MSLSPPRLAKASTAVPSALRTFALAPRWHRSCTMGAEDASHAMMSAASPPGMMVSGETLWSSNLATFD